MILVCDHDHSVGAIGNCVEVPAADCIPIDAKIRAAFVDGAHDIRAQALIDADPYAFVLLHEICDVLRQESGDGRHASCHADMALDAQRIFGKLCLDA